MTEYVKIPRTSDPKEVERFYRAVAEKLNGLLTAPTWTEVTSFSNSWGNFDTCTAAYCKDAFGFVHLRGHLSGGTPLAAAFTLPVGYRPSLTQYFGSVDAANAQISFVYVSTAGAVVPYDADFTTLNGITFYAG